MSEPESSPEFWQCETSKFEALVEEEVYQAVRECLTTDNPDFFLDWLITIAERGLCVHIFVDGGKGRKPIERDFSLEEMLAYEIETRQDAQEGQVWFEPDDRALFTSWAESLRACLSRVEDVLANAREYPPDEPTVAS